MEQDVGVWVETIPESCQVIARRARPDWDVWRLVLGKEEIGAVRRSVRNGWTVYLERGPVDGFDAASVLDACLLVSGLVAAGLIWREQE